MINWVVKLTEHKGQYRITLPGKLVVMCRMEDVEFVTLQEWGPGGILIEEYHGKSKEKRDIPEDQA